MDPVEYSLSLQRLFVVLCGLSFAGLSGILVFLDPTENQLFVWAFLLVLYLFVFSLLAILAFWWIFSFRATILTVYQVNQLVYQSGISSATILFYFLMRQTGQLNIWTGILLILVYSLYQLWMYSDNK